MEHLIDETVGDKVYLELRKDLLESRHEPGSRLYSEELKAVHNCSPSPLKEALSRLNAEGLVTKVGQRGYRVADVSLSEMWDITHLRVLLECEAFRQSIASGGSEWEEQIVATFYSLAKPLTSESKEEASIEWEFKHRKFHKALLSACPSPWLLTLVGLLQSHSERYQRLRLVQTESHFDGTHSHEQHEQLKQVALNRDADIATTLLQSHIEDTAHFIQHHWETHGGA